MDAVAARIRFVGAALAVGVVTEWVLAVVRLRQRRTELGPEGIYYGRMSKSKCRSAGLAGVATHLFNRFYCWNLPIGQIYQLWVGY